MQASTASTISPSCWYANNAYVVVGNSVLQVKNAAAKIMQKAKLTAEDLAALKVEIEAMKLVRDHDKFVKLYGT
jgi:hypothetical protein